MKYFCIEELGILGIEVVYHEKRHFQTTLGETEDFSAGRGIDGRRADDVEHLGPVLAEEVGAAGNLVVDIVPEVFGEHGKLHRLVERCGHEIVVGVGGERLHAVGESHVVLVEVVLLHPLVELIGRGCGVEHVWFRLEY